MVDFFHGRRLTVVLHTCGSTAEAMLLIIEAGFDAVNPMQRKALNNEPFVFAEKYGDRIAFIGGFDARIFETNDKDTIRREVASYIEGMRARGARLGPPDLDQRALRQLPLRRRELSRAYVVLTTK